jgi:SAM-dependent methyltransferase
MASTLRPAYKIAQAFWVVAALGSGAVAWWAGTLPGGAMWDATQFWLGARALWHGLDPYTLVRERLPYPLFYPLPAVLLFLPFAVPPPETARVLWAGVGGGLLALAARKRPVLWGALLSGSYADALVLGQWSPLLTASSVLPALSVTWAAKPSVGLAFFLAYGKRTHLPLILGLVLVSLLVMPSWPGRWLEAVGQQIHRAPALRPGGFLLLLAWIRWRAPEGRLLGTLALVPHSTALYETLPLFLCLRSRGEAYGLAVLTYVAAFLAQAWYPWDHDTQTLGDNLTARWPLVLGLVYLPVLVAVLRPTPRPGY